MRRTTLMAGTLVSCLAGLALGRRGPPTIWLVAVSVVSLMIRRRPWLGWCLLALALGWWRGLLFRDQLRPYESLYGQPVIVQVTARSDGVYAQSGNLGFDGGSVQIIEPFRQPLPGVIKLETRGLPAVYRSDRLEVSGKLYPAGGSRQGSIKFAQGRLLQRRLNRLERFRLRFAASLQTALPEPQASFALGILVGQRSTLPQAVEEQLSIAGLTHIIAVSGYNLTILIRFAGKRLGRSKFQTYLLSILLIAGFIAITGFSASIVRAGMVSMLSITAWYYGRELKPLLVLLLAAAITAMWYPVYLWSDIGWYLSFLAFFGVLILAPLLTAWCWRGRQPRGLMPLVIESGCAQVMAAPLIMYIFGETSLIALPANLLIVPLIPLAMLLSAIGGLTGMLMPVLASWLAWPARLLLGYMLQMVDWMSRTPGALADIALSLPALVTIYGLVVLICWRWWLQTRPPYGKITDEGD